MSFFATSSYPELPASNPSLIVAWCHLLHNFGKVTNPATLAAYLSDFTDAPDWATITAFDPELSVSTTGKDWPKSKNSIVTFKLADMEGKPYELHCLIFDPADRTIIDSSDATIKNAGVYGSPVSFATYSYTPAPVIVESAPEIVAAPDPERTYTVLSGERIFDISRKLDIPSQDLIEHNGIKDPYDLPAGLQLHLPIPVPLPAPAPKPTYKVFDDPRTMHITRQGGAQKWMFGNSKTVDDIVSGSGIYPENKEVRIVAEVRVPIDGETWSYYMDELAIGDYRTSGKVRYTIGFACGDLTPGKSPKPSAEKLSQPTKEQIEQVLASIEPLPVPAVKAPEPEPIRLHEADEVLLSPNRWKGTYEPFVDRWNRETTITHIVDLPGDQDEIMVHDCDQKRPSKRLRDTGHYPIAGTFVKDGVEYGRPLQSVQCSPEMRNWYGIPMSVLKTEQEMYDTTVDLPTKLAIRHSSLTPTEKYIIPGLAMTRLSVERLKWYGKKITNKKER